MDIICNFCHKRCLCATIFLYKNVIIRNEFEIFFIGCNKIVESFILWFGKRFGSRPVFAADVGRVVMVKCLPVHRPVTIEVCASILSTTLADEARSHILALINDLIFFFEMLLHQGRAIDVEDGKEVVFGSSKHLLVFGVLLDNTLMKQFKHSKDWCLHRQKFSRVRGTSDQNCIFIISSFLFHF